MKYAWIENGRIRDLTMSDPFSWHHPDVAKFYDTEVPDDAVNGDSWIDGELIKPAPIIVPEAIPAPRTWADIDVRNGLTLPEKVKWDNNSAPEIVTVKAELNTPQELAGVTELLDFLVSSNVISQASADKILS